MNRAIVTASLFACAAMAVSTPAWAQATFPEGTDCSRISNTARRTDCTHQMNEARQNPTPGAQVPSNQGTGNAQAGSPNQPDSNPSSNDTRSGAADHDAGSGQSGGGAPANP
jgi:hypothetical protein